MIHTLRPARADDADDIVRVHLAAFRELVQARIDWVPEQHTAETRAKVVGQTSEWQVVQCGGEVVGSLWLTRDDDGVCFVNRITLHPDVQGRGIGTAILHDLQAREPALRLSVWDVNRARRLYRRLGFVDTGQVDRRVKMSWPAEGPRAPTLPEDLEALDGPWLSAILGTRITAATPTGELPGIAMTAQVARFELEGDGPASIVVKLGHRPRGYGQYARELETIRRLGDVLPMPRCLAWLDEGNRTLLVLEDLSGRRPGHRFSGAGLSAGRNLLRAVAGWQRPTWEQDADWPPRKTFPDPAAHRDRGRDAWARLDHARFPTEPPTREAIARLLDELPDAMAALTGGPHALCHCDLHAENLIFDGDRPYVLDWQNTALAPAAFDVVGALTCLAPDVVAAHHAGLLDTYLEALDRPWDRADLRATIRGGLAAWLAWMLAWFADHADLTERAPEAMHGHWERITHAVRCLT